MRRLLAHHSATALLPSDWPKPWASGIRHFRGCFPTARTLARLHIAAPVTRLVARLAIGLSGSTLAERVSRPLGRLTEFLKSPPSSRTSIAWSYGPNGRKPNAGLS
jgi:hypothetical protein